MSTDLEKTIRPLIESEMSLSQQRMALHEMFALAISNAPDNETDNFTAKKLTPAYLAFCQLLENIAEVS